MVSAQSRCCRARRQSSSARSITPAFEGWFDNPDGTHSFLDRLLQPQHGSGGRHPDRSEQPLRARQSRHGSADALPDRPALRHVHRHGAEGVREARRSSRGCSRSTASRPACRSTCSPDYNITPIKSSEESPDGGYNVPPVLRFARDGPTFDGPGGQRSRRRSRARRRSATPMPLDLWADDDALYSSGTNAPMRNAPPPVTLTVSKYRGPGHGRRSPNARPKFDDAQGRQAGRAVRGQGVDDGHVQRAGRLHAARHRERLLGQRRRRLRLLLDDGHRQGGGEGGLSGVDQRSVVSEHRQRVRSPHGDRTLLAEDSPARAPRETLPGRANHLRDAASRATPRSRRALGAGPT